MHKVLLTVALVLTLATTFLGATKRDFQTGKLVSVTADERLVEGTSYRRAIFTVHIGDLVLNEVDWESTGLCFETWPTNWRAR